MGGLAATPVALGPIGTEATGALASPLLPQSTVF